MPTDHMEETEHLVKQEGIHPVLYILAFIGGLAVVAIMAAVVAKFLKMMGVVT